MARHSVSLMVVLLLSFWSTGATAGPLVEAASRNDTGAVRSLLQGGADVSEAQGDGMTALHWAAELGNAAIAEMLVVAGSNLEAGTRIGSYTPLHVASREGNHDVIGVLIEGGANVNAVTTNSGTTPLHLAAASGSAASVKRLVQAGANVDAREDQWGQTPLTFAASLNRIDAINALLDAGASIDAPSVAVDTGQMEEADRAAEKRITEFLVEFKEKEGGGPNWQPSPSQVQAAIEASREIQRKWPNVPDPICDDYVADQDGQDETKNKCAAVTYNADGLPIYDDSPGEDEDEAAPRPPSYGQRVIAWGGLTPLLHAVRQGHREATTLLLERGADINQVSAGDETSPLLMATVNGQFDLALLLLERGADPNRASLAGTTPLFATIERRWASKSSYSHPTEHQQQAATHYDVMRALLDAGADPNARLNTHLWYSEYTFSVIGNQSAGLHYKGATPFWRAALALDVDAMRLLKEHGADPHIATIKLPERRRRRQEPPPDAEIAAAESKKTVSGRIAAPLVTEKPSGDPSGLPEVPVGGPFVSPIHVVAGAGYGQSWAANAHIHAPDAWLESIRFLVEECGADVNLRDAKGYTALHHAASRGDTEAVQYLIDRGADVMLVSRKGETTVDMANSPYERIPPYPETIALLESYGAINNNNCISC